MSHMKSEAQPYLNTMNRRLDAKILELEQKLVEHPSNEAAVRELVRVLDFHMPTGSGVGAFTNCQKTLIAGHQHLDWAEELLEKEKLFRHWERWQSALGELNAPFSTAITQLFAGRHHEIDGEQAYCNLFLTLFKKQQVIPRICDDCFKVQILPDSFSAMMQVHFVLACLELPRENMRKCMVELREEIKYPYKGYIYCESEEEAEMCLNQFRGAIHKYGLPPVQSKISHGCSEYGARYPEFKFSQEGIHRNFDRPKFWEKAESSFFSNIRIPNRERESFSKQGVSIRDVLGFNTWALYASLIGDDTYKICGTKPVSDPPKPFLVRVRSQAQDRKAQMLELQGMLASS